ncbi:SufD family Fe-S cluster assembly protein [Patescibacteria group bacterium]|nr:SufD family Fe-S cluster assembly protein [Patescibacteria group bacterium]
MEIVDITKNKIEKHIRIAKNRKETFVWLLYKPKVALCNIFFDLETNSHLNNFFLFAGSGDDAFHINMIVNHHGKHSSSRTIIRGFMYNQSTVEIVGEVNVKKRAHFSDTHLDGRALLFQESSARIDPRLEIHTKEIQRATHAAAVSRVNEEELFYLASRGIEPRIAEILKARGFLLAPFFNLDPPHPFGWDEIMNPLMDKFDYVQCK